MTAKEYLSQLYNIEKCRRVLQSRIDELTIRAGYGQGKSYARAFGGDNDRKCPMEIAILDQWEEETKLEELLAEADEKRREIMRVIDAVPDERLRTILIMRHVEFMPWWKIRDELGFKHIRRVHEAHGDALLLVKVPKPQNVV